MHVDTKQDTFIKDGFNMIKKVCDLPSAKSWKASVEVDGSARSSAKPESTRANQNQTKNNDTTKKRTKDSPSKS